MPRRIPLSELIPSMPYPSPTARSRLTQFSDEVSWQKVDSQAAAAASGEEDITEGGDNQGGNQGGGTTGGELE